MENLEFEIAVKKLDLLENKICFTEKILSETEDNLISLDYASTKFIPLFYFLIESFNEVPASPIILNEIIKLSEKFYNENKKQYNIDSKKYAELMQSKNNYKRMFDKISNQLEFLREKQR